MNALEHGLGSDQMRAACEHHCEIGGNAAETQQCGVRRLCPGLERVVLGRDSGTDPDRSTILRAMPRAEVIALFGPTGVGKTESRSSSPARLRDLGERPVAVSADALQVYPGLETLTGAAAPRSEAARAPADLVPARRCHLQRRPVRGARPRRDRRAARRRRPADRRRWDGPVPPRRADRVEPSPAPPRGVREYWVAELERRGPPRCTASARASAVGGIGDRPRRPPADRPRARAARRRRARAARPSPPSCGRARSAIRRCSSAWCSSASSSTTGSTPGWTRWSRRAREEGARGQRPRASVTARKALGFEELLAGDIDAMKRRTRNYARRQLTWMRKLAGIKVIDATGRTADDVSADVLALWHRPAAPERRAGCSGQRGERVHHTPPRARTHPRVVRAAGAGPMRAIRSATAR